MRAAEATALERRGPRWQFARAASRAFVYALLAVVLTGVRAQLGAQTLTSGMVTGVVRDAGGLPMGNVHVIARESATGMSRSTRTDTEGRFEFRLLAEGDYAVFAERLGYRPQAVFDIPLPPGRALVVDLELATAEPPVMTIDSVPYGAHRAAWSQPGATRWFGDLELDAPRIRESADELQQLSSMVDIDGSVEGLPASFTRYATEGFAFAPLTTPGLFTTSARSAQALAAIDHAELATSMTEIEAAGSAGARFNAYGRRGTRDFQARVWGTGSDPAVALGPFSDDVATLYDLGRAGAEISGPIIRDSAVFRIGGEWRNTARALPRAFRIDDPSGATVLSAARDSAGLSLLALSLPFVEERTEIAGWGRFDWRITDNHELSTFADVSLSPAADDVSPLRATPLNGGTGEWLEATAGASLRSTLSRRFSNELRAALVRSTRDELLPGGTDARVFGNGGVAPTAVVDGDLLFGADPYAPYSLARTGIQVEQALLVSLGSHLLKVGFAGELDSRDYTFALGGPGRFTFGGPEQLLDGTGAFFQTVGTLPGASFSTLETGAFIQDRWRPAAGLEVIAGLRVMGERLPSDLGVRNGLWLELTGLANDSIDDSITQFSPRFDLRWDVRNRGQWLVRAGFGLDHDDVAPELLAELITHDGGVRARRALGDIGAWPDVPDSTLAPVQGPLLTLFGPDFAPPRSTRASLGLSRLGGTSVHVSASYRHTDFLPSRRDLNLLASPSGQDQYGRPVFGDLEQQGSLVAVTPGSNRRFTGFDVVSAIESSAFSDYWGATVLLERRLGDNIRFAGSYTFSRTRDNWLIGGFEGSPAIAPRLGDGAGDSDWAEGVSDFDVPHRVSVVGEFGLPLPLSPMLGVSWRARSAQPFTPGFRAGVDVNGDYASNDPAFVDEEIDGMDVLLDRWTCLRDGVGEFAERNSCRGDMLHFLDLRLGVETSIAGTGARIFADVLNLLEQEIGTPDRALYLIDAGTELVADPETGTVTVPLVVNPSFGDPVRSLSTGRIYRIGIEVEL